MDPKIKRAVREQARRPDVAERLRRLAAKALLRLALLEREIERCQRCEA